MRPCVSVQGARHGEDGLVEVECIAERVVALSYTEVIHTIMEEEKNIEM